MVIILLFVWDFMWIKSLVLNIRRRLDCFLCSVSILIIACGMFVERLCLLKGPKIIQARPLFYYIHGLKIFIEKTYHFIHTNENNTWLMTIKTNFHILTFLCCIWYQFSWSACGSNEHKKHMECVFYYFKF